MSLHFFSRFLPGYSPFPCIEILKLNGNQIFEKTEDAVADSAGEILSQFINAARTHSCSKEINLTIMENIYMFRRTSWKVFI